MFPNLGSSEQEAAIIVGFFLPLVLAIPIQDHWPNTIRTLFSVAAYAAAGAIVAATAGKLNGKSFWQVTLEVLTLGVIGYQGVWKPSGLAPAIESATSTRPAGSPPPVASALAAEPAATTSAPTSSTLEPQIGELLTASVKLLEHATQRIAGVPAGPADTPAQLAAPKRGADIAGEASAAASAVRTADVVDAMEIIDRAVLDAASAPATNSTSSQTEQPAPANGGAAIATPPETETEAPREHPTTVVQRW